MGTGTKYGDSPFHLFERCTVFALQKNQIVKGSAIVDSQGEGVSTIPPPAIQVTADIRMHLSRIRNEEIGK